MRLPVDDALYRVDARYLGPKGWSLPWQARYASYGIGFLIFLASMAVIHNVVPFPASAVIALAVTVGVTTVVSRRIDHERPARTVIQGFWSEVTARRPSARVSTVMRAPKVSR